MTFAGTDIVDESRASKAAPAAPVAAIMPVAAPPAAPVAAPAAAITPVAAPPSALETQVATSVAAIKASPTALLVMKVAAGGLVLYGAYKLVAGGGAQKVIGDLPAKCSQSRFKRAKACRKPWRGKFSAASR